jgi:hypothetical protein
MRTPSEHLEKAEQLLKMVDDQIQPGVTVIASDLIALANAHISLAAAAKLIEQADEAIKVLREET